MYCSRCGAENPDGSQICVSCNQPLAAPVGAQAVTQQPAIAPKTSGLAITAFVLAILVPFTCGITFLPAIICGIIALVMISGSNGRQKGIGFAVAGIAVPVVILPILALMMGILMPALAEVRRMAYRVTCGSNLQGLSRAMTVYISENDGNFPEGDKWCDLLMENAYVSPKQFICKGAMEGPSNYALNKNVLKLGSNAPPDMVLLFESPPGWNQVGGLELLTLDNHYGEGCNVAFVDGHVEFVKAEGVDDLRWTADQ
jgi:prepilin-type processing-associated H-X9-DG protein